MQKQGHTEEELDRMLIASISAGEQYGDLSDMLAPVHPFTVPDESEE